MPECMNFRMWKGTWQDRGSDRVCADGRADSGTCKTDWRAAKHIFSHVEWHMTGYELLVDELEKTSAPNVGQMCVENGADGSENYLQS